MTTTYGSTLYSVSSEIRVAESPLSQETKSDPETFVNSKKPGLSHLCCLHVPHYRLRTFKNKAAYLVLLWSFFGFCVFHFLISDYGNKNPLTIHKKEVSPVLILAICVLIYPVHGWLADVRFGRYKIIKWSMRVMLVLLILFCVAVVLLEYQSLSNTSDVSAPLKRTGKITRIVLYGLISLGLGGFLANIVQFGIDQLIDASSSEITLFLRWLSWIFFLSKMFIATSQSCVCDYHKSLGYLLLPGVMTIAISSDHLLSHWLVKEPGSDNPLILIFKVLRYAKKNKYPRQRSAFTYWDDRRYSRIDLGKDKYGGPFSTEEVEDVKTFFRIISIIIAGCFFVSLCISVYPVYGEIFYHLHDEHYVGHKKYDCECSIIKDCFQRVVIRDSGSFLMVIGLPLFEFIFYPFKKYLKVSILKRMSIGMAMLLLAFVACSAIEFVAQHKSHQLINKTCPLTARDQPNSLSLDYKWVMFPSMLFSVAVFLLLTSFSEFLCAQSPYSMKGFLFGFTYGSVGFFTMLGYLVSKIIQLITEKWLSYRYGCLFWYLILYLAILFIIIVIFFFAFKCYKRRLRDDDEHNEQIFAVNYYSQCPDSTE